MGDTKDPATSTTAAAGKLERPGADLPLDAYIKAPEIIFVKDENGKDTTQVNRVSRFPSAVVEDEWKSNTVTLRERAMMRVLDSITDKPGWEDKVNDEAITSKWRKEALAMPLKQGFSEAMFDYTLAELQEKARLFKTNGRVVSVYDGAAAVFKTDVALDEAITARLRAEVAKLEANEDKDWHPGSNEQVLDLVHPSLWPLVYGKTRVLKDREISLEDALSSWGSGEVLPKSEAPKKEKNRYSPDPNRLLSRNFQWLPAEVDVKDGKAKFASYINNLHPEEHREMYAVLETLVERALPLWHAAYDRVMQWLGSDDGKHWSNDEKKRVTRIWCMTSNRQCTTPEVCKNYCDAYNRPKTDDEGSDGEGSDGEGSAAGNDDAEDDAEDDDEDDDDDGDDGDDGDEADDAEDGDEAPVADADAADNSADGADEGDAESNDGSLEDLDVSSDDGENLVEVVTELQLSSEESGEDDEGDDEEDDDNSIGVAAGDDYVGSWRPPAGDQKAPPADGDISSESEEEAYDTEHEEELKDQRWYDATHKVMQPEPDAFSFTGYDYSKPNAFANKRLQVIVKLANIHLTPEKPTYDGGSWHIEGQLNERIVATALYYYDNDNVTDSHLSFRTPCDAETMVENFEYDQNDHKPFTKIYGASPGLDDHSTVLEFGRVLTRQGRLLVFPNVLQHRVGSFELADKTKPGHRKIVALFLVDPETPVISTANVPPQQMHWSDKAGPSVPSLVSGKLPPEIAEMVYQEMGCPFRLDEAKQIRQELIEERKALDTAANDAVNYADWSFCEH